MFAVLDFAISSKELKNLPHGISCHYYRLDNNKGLKIYKDKQERDEAHQIQQIASFSGLAPETYEKLEIEVEGNTMFCYITEHVSILYDNNLTPYAFQAKYRRKIDQLHKDLIHCCDFHMDKNVRNYGEKHGELVCIDFGWCDTEYSDYWESF